MSSPVNSFSRKENLFATIYQLAKKCDEPALQKIIDEGGCINIKVGAFSILTLLARHNEQRAVNLIINQFKGNLTDAAKGYALGGHFEPLHQLIQLGADSSWAIYAYAMAGDEKKVKELISNEKFQFDLHNAAAEGYARGGWIEKAKSCLSQGANIFSVACGLLAAGRQCEATALFTMTPSNIEQWEGFCGKWESCLEGGYLDELKHLLKYHNSHVEILAEAGFVDEVKEAINQNNNCLNSALYGFAAGGHMEEVKELLAEGANISYALQGFIQSSHFDQFNFFFSSYFAQYADSISKSNPLDLSQEFYYPFSNPNQALRLFAFINNHNFRSTAIQHYYGENDDLYQQATHLNQVMRNYALGYDQAKTFTLNPSTKRWLLLGAELVQKGSLPREIFLTISAYSCGLTSLTDTEKVFNLVHKKLLDRTNNDINSKFKSELFKPQRQQKLAEVQESYKIRSSLKRN